MVDAVIFDMDGVMFDTERLSEEVWEEVGGELRVPDLVAFRPKLMGANAERIRLLLSQHCGPDFRAGDFLAETGRRMDARIAAQGVPVKDGLRELLDYLKKEGCPCAVASSTRREKVLSYCGQTGVAGYFRKIICGDMVRRSKPDPQIYLTAAAELGVKPASCMVLEDSPNGCEAGVRAGMKTVLVPDRVQPDARLRSMVFACVPSLRAVIPLLERMKRKEGAAG